MDNQNHPMEMIVAQIFLPLTLIQQ